MLSPKDFRPVQQPGIDFVYQGDQTLLLADVGTGKSVMMLTVLQEWAEEKIMDRALVVAPKRVCLETWMNEIDEWSHLSKRKLRIACLAGADVKTRIHRIEMTDQSLVFGTNVLLINYELLPWLMAGYPNGLPGVNVLVCDEIDKLKDHKTKRFKGVPKRRGTKATPGMKDWRENFDIHVGMTGTPTPNHLLDLWAQVFIIDGGKRLGDNFYKFRDMHFYQSDWGGFKYEILPGREEYIFEQIRDITHRIASIPGVDTPEVVELPVRWVDLALSTRKEYKKLERDYIVMLKADDKEAEVEADNAGVLYGKLKQISQGFAYTDDDPIHLSKEKYKELDSLISELQGQQLIIVYYFVEQLAELQRRYKQLQFLGGGTTDAAAKMIIAEWNEGNIQLLALHPMSAGHGLNLQKSGAQ